MNLSQINVALIKGDGIGVDVTDATIAVVNAALAEVSGPEIAYREFLAGAAYYQQHGIDLEPGVEEAVGSCDAIFLGALCGN